MCNVSFHFHRLAFDQAFDSLFEFSFFHVGGVQQFRVFGLAFEPVDQQVDQPPFPRQLVLFVQQFEEGEGVLEVEVAEVEGLGGCVQADGAELEWQKSPFANGPQRLMIADAPENCSPDPLEAGGDKFQVDNGAQGILLAKLSIIRCWGVCMQALFTVRTAEIKDSEAIAEVQIQSWRETYPGIMPQERLDGMNRERSTRHWQANITGAFTVLVAEAEGRVVGFASGGDNFECENCETGRGNACDCELGALYLLREFQRRGIRKALFERYAWHKQQQRRQTMIVWVAEKNPSTGFYAARGGELADRKTLTVCGVPVPVLGYRYKLEELSG